MSVLFGKEELLDRINETDYIYNDIISSYENKIMIVWSDSGIGKSSLVNKLFLRNYENKIIIQVNTPPINRNEMIVAGQYISYIALAFNSILSEYNFSMKDYLLCGFNKRKTAKEVSKLISGISKLPFEFLNLISDKILGTGEMDTDYILNSTDTESILINQKYLEMALDEFYIILNISNMQNIDSLSLSILYDILQKTNNNYYIFEYTTLDENTDFLYRLYQQLNQKVPTELMHLDHLPFDEVITLIGNKQSLSSSDLLNYYMKTIRGNLFKIRNLNYSNNGQEIIKFNYDSTEELISKMSAASKIWLYIIVLHDGNMSFDLFIHIIDYFRSQIYFDDLTIWSEIDCLVDKDEKVIKLKHASIAESMSNIQITHSFTTYDMLCKFYDYLLNNGEYTYCTKKDVVLRVIKLYSIYAPQNILNYLDYLHDILVASVSQKQVSLIVKKVYASIANSKDELKFYIISLCYNIGLYKEAYDFLKDIHTYTEAFIALKCALLNRMDMHKEFLELYNKYINKKNNSVRFSLILKIFYILSNKSLAQISNCQFMFDNVKTSKEYYNIYEYGFFLRNAQILLTYSESIPFVKESVAFFEKHGALKDTDNSKLTLAVQYARIGNISQAKEIIKDIKKRLLSKTFEKHIIYNDEAAISLLNGNTDETVFLLLEKAFITAVTLFDKISILNNQLCWLIDNKLSDNRFINIKNKILDILVKEPDLRLHKRSYLNISQYYYIVTNEIENQQHYLQKAQSIRINGDDLNIAFFNKNTTIKDLKFQINKDYLVSFIVYWHFDLPML